MRQGEIRSLTGLRGIAAVVVMAYHFQSVPGIPVMGLSRLGPGYLMVDLFFVLSGFVMARTYGGAFGGGMSWPRYGAFLEARFARVYPLYALVCVSVFLLTKLHVTTSASFPVRAFVADMPLLENLGAGRIGPGFAEYLDPPSWSISTELGAYLLFPVLASLALHRSLAAACALLVFCAAIVVWLSVMPHAWRGAPFSGDPLNISSGETLWPLVRCLAEFTVGLLTYRAALHLSAMRRQAWVDALLVAVLAAVWLVPEADVLIVALFPVLILQLCQDATPLARGLGTTVAYRLGEWSYAIYLLHWPALDLLRLFKPLLLRAGVVHAHEVSLTIIAGVVMIASAAVHIIVEKPARAFLRGLFHRRARPIQMEPSAP